MRYKRIKVRIYIHAYITDNLDYTHMYTSKDKTSIGHFIHVDSFTYEEIIEYQGDQEEDKDSKGQ